MKLEFEGEKIRIRKLKLSDADDVFRNKKDKEIAKYASNISYPHYKNDVVRFIRISHQDIKSKKRYSLGIVLKETNKVIGGIGLHDINFRNRNAGIGYWIGKKYWRKGLTSEAMKLLLNFGFKQLRLHRVCGIVSEENIASQKVLEKFGFKVEGKLKDEYYRAKKWHNGLIYGLINEKQK